MSDNILHTYRPPRPVTKIALLFVLKVKRHYATSRKVAGSRPCEVNAFFSIYLISPAVLGPEVYSASNRNKYQKQKNNVFGEWSAAGA
jgi:hypothetical protein